MTTSPISSSAAVAVRPREPSFKAPLELVSWEDEAVVETIEKDSNGQLFFIIVWGKEGDKKSRHRSEVIYEKMPKQALKFCEAKLVFRTPDADRQG